MSDSDAEEVEYESETFHFREHKLVVTTIAYMPLTVLLKNQTKATEQSGQKLWCGSLVLINYLLKYPHIIQNSIAIELGAGTGLVSMIAKKLGAVITIPTDHDSKSLEHMIQDFQYNHITDSFIEILNWYEPNLARIQDIMLSAEGSSDKKVVLLAGDVLYKAVLIEPFFHTVLALFQLCRHQSIGCEFYLCHIPRAGVTHAMIQQAMIKHLQVPLATSTDSTLSLTIEEVNRSLWMVTEEEDGGIMKGYCSQEDFDAAKLYKLVLSKRM